MWCNNSISCSRCCSEKSGTDRCLNRDGTSGGGFVLVCGAGGVVLVFGAEGVVLVCGAEGVLLVCGLGGVVLVCTVLEVWC